jgi:hypothetical protein
MFFSKPIVEFPKITAPAADVCAKSNPSTEGKALLTPGMTAPHYVNTLEKNKMSVDMVHFFAHGLPEKDGICWACQSSRLVAPKMSTPEMNCLQLTENWLKFPKPNVHLDLQAALGKIDFTGPGGWTAQAAMWSICPPSAPGMPAGPVVAAAIVGAILLAAGLSIGLAMPAIPKPKLQIPMMRLPPNIMAQFKSPAVPQLPSLDQPKMMKMLFPFIDLGKGVASCKVTCC